MINIVQGKKISNGAKSLLLELTSRGEIAKKALYNSISWGNYITGMQSSIKKKNLFVNWGDAQNFSGLLGYQQKMAQADNWVLNLKISGYSDKRAFFKHIAASDPTLIPKYWTNTGYAQEWLMSQNSKAKLCIRYKTSSSGSNGLEIVSAVDVPNGLPYAPLYTQYIPKKQEFRCHILRGSPDIWQQKKLKSGVSMPNFQIRNLQNGWIFAREDIQVPAAAIILMEKFKLIFFDKWGLDFAGVDVIYNEEQGKAYLLEINTAPGLEGQTVKDYADFIVKMKNKYTNV